jgi:hypothetical protein
LYPYRATANAQSYRLRDIHEECQLAE